MAAEYPLFSTIDPDVLLAFGALVLATIGSAVGFLIAKERKKLWGNATLALAFLCLVMGAVCLALSLR